jgi:hypothetical protein
MGGFWYVEGFWMLTDEVNWTACTEALSEAEEAKS